MPNSVTTSAAAQGMMQKSLHSSHSGRRYAGLWLDGEGGRPSENPLLGVLSKPDCTPTEGAGATKLRFLCRMSCKFKSCSLLL